MRKFSIVLVFAVSASIGACAKKPVPGAIVTDIQRTEKVRYNKRDYIVAFKYDNGSARYNVNVKRVSRPLSNSAKDKDNAVQVASSTVSYYSCPKGYRGKLVPGSASYNSNKSWKLAAKCEQRG